MSALDTIKSSINLAGNIGNALTDATLKDFYSLRDFYNFIRKDQNCPMQHKNFFTVVPEIPVPGIASFFSGVSNAGSFFKAAWKSIKNTANAGNTEAAEFQFNQYNLARFALSIKSIKLTSFSNLSEDGQVKSPFGKYTYIKDQDGYLGAKDNAFSASFIEMAKPIIEDFIVPWMIGIQKNTKLKKDQYTKINLLIKFYRTDEIAGLDFLMNPAFIYRITGVYPKSVELVSPAYGPGSSSGDGRIVTFNFNNIMVYSSAQYEQLIAGGRIGFQYNDQSPLQILNKLNSQAGSIASIYNQAKNIF